eukprot:2856533-Lingulodinium_polyedra.AAC.1
MQQFLRNRRKLLQYPGCSWLLDGEVETALRHAARNCFRPLGKAQVRKLMHFLGVQLAPDGSFLHDLQ